MNTIYFTVLVASIIIVAATLEDTCVLPYYCGQQQNLYCNETLEHEWLVDLYNSTNGDNWFNNTNWLSDSNHCEWYGIHCCTIFHDDTNNTATTDTRTSTRTSYTTLTTPSNSNLKTMTVQRCINFVLFLENNLLGSLPNYWPNSTVLTTLSMEENYLTGTLPDYSKLLPNLGVISFRKNNLTGIIPPFPIGNCVTYFTLDTNFFYGCLPDWSNQIWLTQVDLTRNNLNGTIPDWSKWKIPEYIELNLLDLSYHWEMTRYNTFWGTIPNWSNWSDFSINSIKLPKLGLEGTVPKLPRFAFWNKYVTHRANKPILELSHNKLNGTFPFESLGNIWSVELQQNEFDSDISGLKQSIKDLSYLKMLNLSFNQFDGTIPCLNELVALKYLDIRHNKFSRFEIERKNSNDDDETSNQFVNDTSCVWPDGLSYFLVSNNKFEGNLQNIVKNYGSINVTSINGNDTNNSNETNLNFISSQPYLTNLSVFDISSNMINGKIPSSLFNASDNLKGIYFNLQNNDLSCNLPKSNSINGRGFDQIWLIIGNTFNLPFQDYVNKDEKSLSFVAVPNKDWLEYFTMPLLSSFIALIVYICIFIKLKSKKSKQRINYNSINNLENKKTQKKIEDKNVTKNNNLNLNDDSQDSKITQENLNGNLAFMDSLQSSLLSSEVFIDNIQKSMGNHSFLSINSANNPNSLATELPLEYQQKWLFLKLLQAAVIAIFILTVVSLIMAIFYELNSNYIECGYNSLKFTITYFGGNYNEINVYDWIILIFYCIYTMISTATVYAIHRVSKSDISQSQSQLQEQENTEINEINNINANAITSTKWQRIKTFLLYAFKILLFITLTLLTLGVMSSAVIIYNIFHSSLPLTDSSFNLSISTKSIELIFTYLVPFVVSLEKYFLLPFFASKLTNILFMFSNNSNNSNDKKRYYSRHLIQIFRLFILIFCPIIVSLYFDNGCMQHWKQFWHYCSESNQYHKGTQCPVQQAFYPTNVVICFNMCQEINFLTKIVWNRCLRRMLEVLAPLYLFKMIIAVWFPLLVLVFNQFIFRYINKKNGAALTQEKGLKVQSCDNEKLLQQQLESASNEQHDAYGKNESNKMLTMGSFEPEYVSLLSSIEMSIVFGWAVPLLNVLYLIAIYGYFVVYNKIAPMKQTMLRKYFCVSYYLILSLCVQHTFGCMFFWSTQSTLFGLVTVVNAFVNALILCFGFGFYRFHA